MPDFYRLKPLRWPTASLYLGVPVLRYRTGPPQLHSIMGTSPFSALPSLWPITMGRRQATSILGGQLLKYPGPHQGTLVPRFHVRSRPLRPMSSSSPASSGWGWLHPSLPTLRLLGGSGRLLGCVGGLSRRAIITRYLVAAQLEAGGAFLFCGRELVAPFPFLPLPFGWLPPRKRR